MKQYFFIIFLTLSLSACGPMVTFDKPQPEGVNNLSEIPGKLIGKYMSNDGVARLVIDSNSMTILYDYEVKQCKDSVDWVDMSEGDKQNYKFVGDSIIEYIHNADTLFCFTKENILKKYRGYYILNTKLDDDSWYVQKMKLRRGLLTIGSISTKQELDLLEEINESPIDTISYQISFNRKQFRTCLKSGFSDIDTFKRMK